MFGSLIDLMRSVLLIGIGGISFFAANGAGVKDAAAKVYMNFGTCSGGNPSTYSFVNRIKSDYNILVCENAMKFQSTEPSQGKFSYGGGDQVVTFAQANNMLVRGHTMVWHAQTSSWIQGFSRDQMLKAMKNHIDTVMGHWKGKILEWDVVNEAVSDAGNALRSSFWSQKIGNDFIDSAFVYARKADPNALLYYNDYGTEGTGAKANYVYTMVKGMKERNIPIDGVGLQCHLGSSVNKANISSNIKRLGDLGLRVSCTEIDIRPGSAQAWANLVGAAVENYNATTIMCWGFDDSHSWLGNPCNCQMWDAQGQPKADYISAVEAAFNNGDPIVAEKRKAFIAQSTAVKDGIGHLAGSKGRNVSFTFNNSGFSYYLPSNRIVKMQVVDMMGKTAANLDLGMQPSGTHTVPWSRQKLPAGLYFATIIAGDQKVNLKFAKAQ